MNADPQVVVISGPELDLLLSAKLEAERLRGILESAIADFRKLKPFIGDAADATADLYQTYITP